MEHFALSPILISCRSQIGSRRHSRTDLGVAEETYPPRYWPGDRPLAHVEFAFKYEALSLDLMEQAFRKISPQEVDAYLGEKPTSKFRKKIGYLFASLTAHELKTVMTGNYVPLLDPTKFFTGKPRRIPRWRVIDNLLGTPGASPIVRRTPQIEAKLKHDWAGQVRALTAKTNPRLWARAVNYLYRKETKASFEIEREEITPDREERFIAALARSSSIASESLLEESRLTELQNLIVDSRYAEKRFRKDQNYVGQSLPNYREKVHYVCPPPHLVSTLMAGLRSFRVRSEEIPSPIRAAVVSFGFVYVHPFSDGNGRIHRLLLHESLSIDKYTDPGVVLPFSAPMLRDEAAYDRVLETISNVVNQRVRYHLESDGKLILDESRSAEGIWRYPDLTPHVEYVLDVIETVVTKDLPEELDTLNKVDGAVGGIKKIVDMPDQKMSLLLSLLMQNQGRLSQKKRVSNFSELTDSEILQIENAFRDHFGPLSAG